MNFLFAKQNIARCKQIIKNKEEVLLTSQR